MTRHAGAAVAALALMLVALLVPAGAGWAHDVLLDSGPRAGQSVDTVPEAVELTFNNPPMLIGSQVVVADAEGVDRADGELQVVDTVVSQPLAPDAPAGRYTVTWRVVSSDGHPISGTFAFTALEGATPDSATATSAAPSPTPGEEPEETATATAQPTTAAPTDAATATATAEPTAGEGEPVAGAQEDVDTGSPVAFVVGLAVLALALSALGYTLLRRRRVSRAGDGG